MRASYAVTAAGVCCLILFLIMSRTAEGSEFSLGRERNTASSSHSSQREMFATEFDADDDVDDDYDQDNGIKKFGLMDEDEGDDGMEKSALSDEYDDNGDEDSYDRAYAFQSEGDDGTIQEDGEPSKEYMKELLNDEKSKEKKKEPSQAYMSSNRLTWFKLKHISHGSRIALQVKRHSYIWIDLPHRNDRLSHWSGCPNLYFDSSDVNRCPSMLFTMFRHQGPGTVKNGDIVALYNPKRNQWLGCCQKHCRGSTCPGGVHHRYGFQDPEKWFRCYGEVFRIYARNKALGTPIMSHDQVALYYLQGGSWLEAHGWLIKSTCMGHRPPETNNFERCHAATLEINAV